MATGGVSARIGFDEKSNLNSIVDIGFGSAYKLVTYLGEYETVGLELPVNVEKLQIKYPKRTWIVSDFTIKPDIVTDVIVCADVIEHLVDPDKLLDYIKGIKYKCLILSTPDRDLIYSSSDKEYSGPLANEAHVREWNYT